MTKQWIPEIQIDAKPVYMALAEALSRDVENGRLKAGDRLPTHRDLADEMKFAVGTVTKAYAEAEKRGLIHSNGRSGTFVGPRKNDESELSAFMADRPEMIDFSMGRPLYSCDPDLGSALKEISRNKDVNRLLQYPDPYGSRKHKEAGADWIRRLGTDANPDSVILSSGCQNGLFTILSAVTKPGDTVFTEEFVYPGIKSAADALHLHLGGIKMDDEGLLPDALSAACRQKKGRVLFCSPDLQNPTSAIMSPERRKAVAKIARKHGLYIIEDTIYRPLLMNPNDMLAQIAPERTFLLTSVSKAVAGGLRVGFILPPNGFERSLLSRTGAIQLMAPSLTFEIFSFWMNNGITDAVIAAKRKEAFARQAVVKRLFGRYNVITHDNSFFFWLKLPEGVKGARFAVDAVKKGVSVAQAEVFALDNTPMTEAVRVYTAAPVRRDSVLEGLKIMLEILSADTAESSSVFI